MNAFRLPASREWPLPGRRLFVAVRNLWTEAEEIHAWYDERERRTFMDEFDRKRRGLPFSGNLRIY